MQSPVTTPLGVVPVGASTININNLGPQTIIRNNGQALAAGDIGTGEIVLVVYDGVNFRLMGSFAADAGAVGGKAPGAANGIATLDTNLQVVQDPANATSTPTINKIPIADQTGGRLAWGWKPVFRGCLVRKSSNQIVSAATSTTITFDLEIYDTDSIHDTVTNNDRLVVPAGVTKVKLGCFVPANAPNTLNDHYVTLHKNGVSISDGGFTNGSFPPTGTSGNTAYPRMGPYWSALLDVTAGDYFTLNYWNGGGSSADTIYATTNGRTWFAMEIIE